MEIMSGVGVLFNSIQILTRNVSEDRSSNLIQYAMSGQCSVVKPDTVENDINSLIVRWGCTSSLPSRELKVINKPKSIHKVYDKVGFRRECLKKGLSVPETFFNVNLMTRYYFHHDEWIVRPNNHLRGFGIDIAYNLDDAIEHCSKYNEYYISRLINKISEFRVMFVSGRVVFIISKTPSDDLSWGENNFTTLRWGEWPLRAVEASYEVFKQSGLDVGAVDVIFDGEEYYVTEVNSAPAMSGPYEASKVGQAFDYILINGRDSFGDPDNYENYRNVIHPSLL